MIKRISLAAVSAALLGALLATSGATAQAPTCPPGTTQNSDYCVNAAGRVLPTVVFKVRPGKDTTAPYRFTTTGTVSWPSSISKADGCKGVVAIRYHAKKGTISFRPVAVHLKNGKCTFTSQVTFKSAKRFVGQRQLGIFVRFQGNAKLLARTAKTGHVTVR